MRSTLTLLALCCIATPAAAQGCVFNPDNLANVGTCNVIPFGDASASWANQKYQTLIPGASITTVPLLIRELAFPPCSTGLRTFKSLTIKMDHYSGTTLTTNFAGNLSANAVTVLNVTNYGWNNTQDTWTPIGLQTPFLYIPFLGELVIDIEVQGAMMSPPSNAGMHRSSTLQRVYATGWVGVPPVTGSTGNAGIKVMLCTDLAWAAPFGTGCKGSNNLTPTLSYANTPKLGAVNFTIDLTQGVGTRPIFLLYGATNAAPTYPIDLTVINMPGCLLYVEPTVSVGAVTNSAGNYSQLTPIPTSPTFVGVRVCNQWFVLDTALPGLGLSASNGGWLMIGS